MVEQNNELLMKNHESCPTGYVPFPEVIATSFNGRGRGSSHGCGCGRGRCRHNRNHSYNKYTDNHQKWENNTEIQEKDGRQSKKNMENICYRYGMKSQWSRTCRTLKHLVDLYQASLNDKDESVETNFVQDDFNYGKIDMKHPDVADFILP